MPSPKPTPTALKLIRGNPGKRAINAQEPKPTPGGGNPPDYLDDYARQQWFSVGAELERLGLLTIVDGNALATYCQAVSRMRRAEAEIVAHGITVEGSHGGRVKNPAVTVAETCANIIKCFSGEFGLTPASRVRLKAEPKKPADKFAEFINEKETG